MALELLSHYRRAVREFRMVPSKGGCFEVSLGDKVIFSKLKEGRFPEPKELIAAIDGSFGIA